MPMYVSHRRGTRRRFRRAAIRLPNCVKVSVIDHGAQEVPDIPIEPVGGGRYPGDMEARVAVLEQIALTTAASLERIERRLDGFDRRFDTLGAAQRRDFRWLLGMMLSTAGMILAAFTGLLGVMAHGFHWL
jgi:hypothetical protein